MNHLWAPWRMEYIAHNLKENSDDDCIFCTRLEADDDEKYFILHRGANAFIIMNLYPYNNGHLMIVPNRHVGDITELNDEELLEISQLINLSIRALQPAINPDGFNIGMNLSRTAGAGITDHIHYHVVPRWSGDTNFMPVLGNTKVISQGLHECYQNLKRALTNILINN